MQQAADIKPCCLFVQGGISMAKLPNGVTLRKDGLYVGRFQYQGIRYNVTDQDMKKCAEKLEKMKYEIKNGIYCKESIVTVNSWFRTWIEEYKVPTSKKNTIKAYETMYEQHIKKPLGSRKIKAVRPEMIQRLYNSLNKQGFAAKTIDLVSTVLHGMFQQAYKNEMIQKNPVPLATLPKMKKARKPRVMDLEEQKLFMEYVKDDEIADICELFLSTGLRSGELRGLDWETDIDFKNKLIHVTGTLNYDKETGWRKDEPKTETSCRDIPMLDNVERLLKRVKRQQLQTRMYMGDKWQPIKGLENLVFLQPTGTPLYKGYLRKHLDNIQKQIVKDGHKFERITPHTFRHTFATRCIENGVPPQVLKEILGHSKLSMTMDLYAHVLPDPMADEIQKIANLF